MLSSTGTGNTIILQKVHFFIFKKFDLPKFIDLIYLFVRDHRGHDRMVVGFTTAYAISTYHN
jgi:hypothetical protein